MSNPYTAVSISGYNATPPADDASQVSSNQLGWDKHKTKLGDPLKTAIETIDANLTIAFGKLFGASILTKGASYTVTTADQGRFIEVTTTATITLPDVASAGDGFSLAVINTGTTTNVTVDGASSETINGSTSITLRPSDSAILTCNGSLWIAAVIQGEVSGTFTGTLTGCTTSPTGSIAYHKSGSKVTLIGPDLTGTSDDANCTITGLPSFLRPSTNQGIACHYVRDNGSMDINAIAEVASTGTIVLGAIGFTGGFTPSGTKGLEDSWSITYDLN